MVTNPNFDYEKFNQIEEVFNLMFGEADFSDEHLTEADRYVMCRMLAVRGRFSAIAGSEQQWLETANNYLQQHNREVIQLRNLKDSARISGQSESGNNL